VATARDLATAAVTGTSAVRCPVCEGDSFAVLLTPEDVERERRWLAAFYRVRTVDAKDHADFTQHEATYVVECRGCRTVLRNPQPTDLELDRRYRNDRYGKRTLEHLLASERDFFRRKAASISLPPKARVLEIGSFVGAFLLAAREVGWTAVGVDIGEETRSFCIDEGLDVRRTIPRGQFDAVFAWNTFDQIANPREVLASIRPLLPEGGRLILRVPNGEFESSCLDLRRSRPRLAERVLRAMAYNNFVTFPYLTGYNPESITRLLAESGFLVQQILGDTILPLADESTCAWASVEEQRYKRAIRRLGIVWPWMDVHARV
jgi:SAM-dependent methyltransferase